jgi:hypothetical protein
MKGRCRKCRCAPTRRQQTLWHQPAKTKIPACRASGRSTRNRHPFLHHRLRQGQLFLPELQNPVVTRSSTTPPFLQSEAGDSNPPGTP